MCGRFHLRLSAEQLREFFELFRVPEVIPRFNIAPTQQVLTITADADGRRSGQFRQWGLVPSWSKTPTEGAKLINARSESAAEKPAFRSAFRHRRCLIPASGFYEWEQVNKHTKQPFNIESSSGDPMAFAGLWERWKSPDGEPLESCTILTTAANEFMAELHDRMPVILPRELFNAWLDTNVTEPEKLKTLLAPCPDDWLVRYPVGKAVNSVRNDSAECVKPVRGNRGLFD